MRVRRVLAPLAGALALSLCAAAAPAVALEPMKLQETAANLANLKMLFGSTANVTFASDIPTTPEGPETADVLAAFGQTRRGESGLVVSPAANLQWLEPVKEIAFYDDQALTVFSDLVVYYEDNRFQEGFGFTSDVPEPGTWGLVLAGAFAVGAALRRTAAQSCSGALDWPWRSRHRDGEG
jgi:hypothetical protein